MNAIPNNLVCDGCGLPASPEHIAGRVCRLELATRYRPVHIGVLFVALAPSARMEDDFYGPPQSKELFDSFLNVLETPSAEELTTPDTEPEDADGARLVEFQRRGYFLTYLSECPIPVGAESTAALIARLGPTLIRRIRFNYRPKSIAPLGEELAPLIEMLNAAGLGPVLTLDEGPVLSIPRTGDGEAIRLFRRAVAAGARRENLSPGL